MKRSPRVRLSAALKKSSLRLSILSLALLLLGSPALATTPIAVDLYQDMESGNAGDALSSTIMNASAHPSTFSWYASNTSWVSTNHHMDLPAAILVGGVTYNGTGGTRSWMFNNNNQQIYVHGSWSARPSQATVGFYFNTAYGYQPGMDIDTVSLSGTTYLVMQTMNRDGLGPRVRPHSSYAGFGGLVGPSVGLTAGKTYWINLHTDINVNQSYLAAFDPANSYAQVGTTVWVASDNTSLNFLELGRVASDQHGNLSDTSQCYFDQVMLDYTNAAFPLLPGGANDNTAPGAPPVVRDGTGPDQDQTLALSSTQLSANWDPAWDAQSGIKAYQYAIGTTQGGTNVVNWTTLICQFGVTKTGLSLTNGQTYYFAVRAINGVGLTGPATNSGGQTYGPTDTTPPGAPAAVRDGSYLLSPDADETDDPHDLFANYDGCSDQESGISGYQYCIGTTPGGTNTVNWTNLAGLRRGVYVSNINPPNGVAPGRYYTSVRAVNNAGLIGPSTTSNGIVVRDPNDTTPPSAPPVVRDGVGADISTQTSTTQLSANWDNSTDAESGIRSYSYAIGTTPGGNNIVGDTQVNYDSPTSHVTVTGLNLAVGQTYYFRVHATNGVWLGSANTNSNGVTIVSGGNNPPTAPANVRDGASADITYTTSNTQLSANWDASTDSDGSVTAYQYAIGTSAGGTQTVNWTTLGNVTTVTKTGLSLTNGQTYYFSVKAVDNLGLAGNATNSNGQTVDTTAPSASANVRDGTGTDISTTSSTTQLSANWDASADAESGISGYQYAIGTSAGGTQTVNWTSLGNVTTVTKTGLTLTVGQTYFVSVKAVNGAGLVGSATNSNGQTVVSVGNVVYFQDNFESWAVHGGAWSSVTGETSTQTMNTSTDYAKAGGKSLKLTDTDTTSSYGASLTKNFSPVISGDIYVRFFVYLPTGYTSANTGCASRRLLHVSCGSNRGQMSLSGATPLMEEIGTWGAVQAPSALSENAWHCLEMHMATPSASTLMEFWVDGVKNSTTLNGSFSGSSTYDKIDFGDISLGAGTNGNGTFYMDELVVSNYYNGTNAVTTYFQDNFETWAVHGGAWSSVNGESASHTLNTSTDYARSGTKSLKITDTDSTGTTGASLTENFSPVISSDIYVRFYIFLPTGYGSANSSCSRRILRVYCGSNYTVITLMGDGLAVNEVGGWGGTGQTAISENQWHCIELHVAPPSASTAIQYWVDGTSAGTCTGAFSGSSTFNYMQLGDVILASGSPNGNGTMYWDEVIVSDSYNGPLP